MDKQKAEAVIEAILFTMGDSVEVEKLAEVIEKDVQETEKILVGMKERYEKADRGIV